MAFTPDMPIAGPYMLCWPECARNVLFVHAQPELAQALILAFRVVVVAVLLDVVLRLGWRLARATPLMRGVLAPVTTAFLGPVVSLIVYAVTDAMGWLPVLVCWAIPLAMIYGVMRGRLWIARWLEQLMTGLRDSSSEHDLRRLVAHALGDPSLRIGYWLPGASRWIEAPGAELLCRHKPTSAAPRASLPALAANPWQCWGMTPGCSRSLCCWTRWRTASVWRSPSNRSTPRCRRCDESWPAPRRWSATCTTARGSG
jgi:hypothetical protein